MYFHEKIPIILLNGKDSVNGRIFSLFHELTHLLLGESAICGDDENTQKKFSVMLLQRIFSSEHDLNISINGVTDLLSYNSLKNYIILIGLVNM